MTSQLIFDSKEAALQHINSLIIAADAEKDSARASLNKYLAESLDKEQTRYYNSFWYRITKKPFKWNIGNIQQLLDEQEGLFGDLTSNCLRGRMYRLKEQIDMLKDLHDSINESIDVSQFVIDI